MIGACARACIPSVAAITVTLAAGHPSDAEAGWWQDLWRTREQQAQQALEKEEFRKAAELSLDPARRGEARFRAGEFELAAAEFGRGTSPEAAFNRGNALVLLGRYQEAVESYDRALAARPEWDAARTNREIARVRQERKQGPDDDAGGTGGKLEADEIVFSDRPKKGDGEDDAEQIDGQAPMGQKEIEAMWLRRIQTRPADFLRAKFSYQAAIRSGDNEGEGDEP